MKTIICAAAEVDLLNSEAAGPDHMFGSHKWQSSWFVSLVLGPNPGFLLRFLRGSQAETLTHSLTHCLDPPARGQVHSSFLSRSLTPITAARNFFFFIMQIVIWCFTQAWMGAGKKWKGSPEISRNFLILLISLCGILCICRAWDRHWFIHCWGCNYLFFFFFICLSICQSISPSIL